MVGFTLGIGSVPFAFGSDSLTYITYKGGNSVRLSGISRDGKIVFGSVKDGYWNAATFDGEWHLLKTGATGDTNMDGLSGDGLTAYGTSRYGLSGWKLGKGRKMVSLPLQGYQLTSSSVDASTILAKSFGGRDVIWENDQARVVPVPTGYDSVSVNGVSGDGRTWVGSGAIILSPVGTGFRLQGLTWKDGVATAYSIPDFDIKVLDGLTPDGKILFGVGSAKNDSGKAERTLVVKSGVAKEYVRPGGYVSDCRITQISADGSVAIGEGYGTTKYEEQSHFAGIWGVDGNFCDAGLLLKTMGLLSYRPNWLKLKGISADGQAIVGEYPSGNDTKSFALNLDKNTWPYVLNRSYLQRIYQGDQPVINFSIARPAPKGGIKLTLQNTSSKLQIPASVTIPAGQSSVNVRFRTTAPEPGTATDEAVTVTVTGPVNTEVLEFNVGPLTLPYGLSNFAIKGGEQSYRLFQLGFKVTQEPLVFSVRSSNPDVLSVQSQVAIPVGESSFQLAFKPGVVAKKTPVRLTFTRGAYSFVSVISVMP